jgi:tRNA pseudouridine32 synthase/23S rRNA pseudouridine746 synthase
MANAGKMREDVLKRPLPVVEGVAPSRQWLPVGPWQTVLDFLTERHPRVGVAVWTARMARGEVVDEAGLRLNARSLYRAGACVFYYREPEEETIIPFVERIVHRDDDLLVVDKPHFLAVVPSGRFLRETLLVRLKKKTGVEDLVPIHRIDRETAGVVMFSLNPKTRGVYASLFQRRQVEKVYEALAHAREGLNFPMTHCSRVVTGEPFFRMREVEGEPNSETHIELIRGAVGGASLYRLRPVTGRKHQLRLHLSALGIPIVNDRLYPDVRPAEPDDFSMPLKLLARSISFRDPLTQRERHFESGASL